MKRPCTTVDDEQALNLTGRLGDGLPPDHLSGPAWPLASVCPLWAARWGTRRTRWWACCPLALRQECSGCARWRVSPLRPCHVVSRRCRASASSRSVVLRWLQARSVWCVWLSSFSAARPCPGQKTKGGADVSAERANHARRHCLKGCIRSLDDWRGGACCVIGLVVAGHQSREDDPYRTETCSCSGH